MSGGPSLTERMLSLAAAYEYHALSSGLGKTYRNVAEDIRQQVAEHVAQEARAWNEAREKRTP